MVGTGAYFLPALDIGNDNHLVTAVCLHVIFTQLVLHSHCLGTFSYLYAEP